MNENFKLIGKQVNSISEALIYLKVGADKIIFTQDETTINGVTFNLFVYTTENNKDWCFSVTACNLESNQYRK